MWPSRECLQRRSLLLCELRPILVIDIETFDDHVLATIVDDEDGEGYRRMRGIRPIVLRQI